MPIYCWWKETKTSGIIQEDVWLFDLSTLPRIPCPCRSSLRAAGSGWGMNDLSSVVQCPMIKVRFQRKAKQVWFSSKTLDFHQVLFIHSASQSPAIIVEIIFVKLRGLVLGRRSTICELFKHCSEKLHKGYMEKFPIAKELWIWFLIET